MDEHTLEVFTKSSSSLIVRVLGIVAALVVSVALGRTLGATGLGIVNLTQQIGAVMLVATTLGMNSVLVKRVAIGYEAGNPEEVASSIRTASWICGTISTVLSLAGVLASPWLSRHLFHTTALEIPLMIAMGMLVPQTFSAINGATLSGFRRIWQSNLVSDSMSMWVAGAVLLLLYVIHWPITVISAAIAFAVGRLAVFVTTGLFRSRLFQYRGPRRSLAGPMLKMAFPLLLANSAYLIMSNVDGVMLGWLRSPREVGLYSVAARVSLMETFFLMVSNSAIMPKVAFLFSQGRKLEMEKMVKRVTGALIVIASLSLALFILFGHQVLSVWGRDFAAAYLVLVILGIGQFFNISTGCCGILLTMCDQEKIIGYISTIFLFLNLALNYFLILHWGVIGAATATAITVAGQNLTTMVIAKKKVGVLTIPF